MLTGLKEPTCLISLDFVLQGVEPEGFPLLLQSLKMDSPVKDMHSNPNKQLYGGETCHKGDVGSLFNRLDLQSSLLLSVLRSGGTLFGCPCFPVGKEAGG